MGVVAYVPDLMLGSRVSGAAKQAGVGLKMCGTADALAAAAPEARLVIVDLNARGAIGLVERVAALAEAPQMVGFVSHVDAETIEAARAAGCGEIQARSAFFPGLAERLTGLTAE